MARKKPQSRERSRSHLSTADAGAANEDPAAVTEEELEALLKEFLTT